MVEKTYPKDPSAILDYPFNWNDPIKGPWLESGEIILSHVVTVDAGITKDSDSESGGVVTVWLSGGTAGEVYDVACLINTSEGRTEERTIRISCTER